MPPKFDDISNTVRVRIQEMIISPFLPLHLQRAIRVHTEIKLNTINKGKPWGNFDYKRLSSYNFTRFKCSSTQMLLLHQYVQCVYESVFIFCASLTVFAKYSFESSLLLSWIVIHKVFRTFRGGSHIKCSPLGKCLVK